MARETEATLAPLAREVVVDIIKRKLSFTFIIRVGRCQAAEIGATGRIAMPAQGVVGRGFDPMNRIATDGADLPSDMSGDGRSWVAKIPTAEKATRTLLVAERAMHAAEIVVADEQDDHHRPQSPTELPKRKARDGRPRG
jgi:hypothetical protein